MRPASARPDRRLRRAPWRGAATALAPVLALALGAAGCGGTTEHLAVSHRLSPGHEARIVVLPVELPAEITLPADESRTLADLYATELLAFYEILELERFDQELAKRNLTRASVLADGLGPTVAAELRVDAVLVSRVYSWDPGTPGFWFLKKPARIGFQARLVDVETGDVIWGLNRVAETAPGRPLSVGLGVVFAELAEKMPRHATSY